MWSQGIPARKPRPQIPRRGLPAKRRIPNVEKVVAVSSAKGGVGKSTIAGTAYQTICESSGI